MASYPVFQITKGDWRSSTFFKILGTNIQTFIVSDPALFANYISNFQTKSDDVFVVSYPKSGTTWVQEIVWQICNGGEVSEEKIGRRFPYLEYANAPGRLRRDFEALPNPRLIKSHLYANVIPKGSDENSRCKYIYVARNPKDVVVSYFYFVQSFTRLELNVENRFHGPWEFFVDLFIEGNVGYSKWTDHVLGWWQQRNDPTVLFLKYEDLQKDLPSNVRTIAKFLQKPLSDELINRIAEQCTFKGMMKNSSNYKQTDEDDNIAQTLRKGVVGDWKNHFTPEMDERFDKEVIGKLSGSGLEFDYEL
ncbi:sulfotransferase 1B1-like [Montipora foliosa]|uniref:sulfotransferase 1B1-like n=1 Tax=Montipora foliosa TaxID=591990 RepID=UPI0035F12901